MRTRVNDTLVRTPRYKIKILLHRSGSMLRLLIFYEILDDIENLLWKRVDLSTASAYRGR